MKREFRIHHSGRMIFCKLNMPEGNKMVPMVIFCHGYNGNCEGFNYHQEFLENIKAPINEGDTLGQLVYKYNGNLLGTVDIVASENIAKATLGSTLKTLWLQYLS